MMTKIYETLVKHYLWSNAHNSQKNKQVTSVLEQDFNKETSAHETM